MPKCKWTGVAGFTKRTLFHEIGNSTSGEREQSSVKCEQCQARPGFYCFTEKVTQPGFFKMLVRQGNRFVAAL
ncbi:hypothetical protein A8F94_23860 [Bacillus sp. FJAT-27225]|nr:hypothetical protein A8F94_23860 [Bacillus sp. FJAT-27225]